MKGIGKWISKGKTNLWYQIKARDISIFKPNGKVITFYLWGKDEAHIKNILKQKGHHTDIHYIKLIGQELPWI